MYYEEKMIDGILHYRTSEKDDFKPFTIQELSDIVVGTALQLHEIYEISRRVQRLDPPKEKGDQDD